MDLDKITTNYDASDEHMGRISSIYFTTRAVSHSKQVAGWDSRPITAFDTVPYQQTSQSLTAF